MKPSAGRCRGAVDADARIDAGCIVQLSRANMTQFDRDIEVILKERFPRIVSLRAFDSMVKAFARPGDLGDPDLSGNPLAQELVDAKEFEAKCRALPPEEIARLASESRLVLRKREAEEAEKQRVRQAAMKAKVEAQRFFNAPDAAADFVFWCRAPYWTADEAAALLLGRDPRRVNPATLEQELNTPVGLIFGKRPARSTFHDDFDGLRIFLPRAAEAAHSRLTPAFVVQWAQQTGRLVPSGLVEQLALPAVSPQLPATGDSSLRWSPENIEKLRAFRDAHGTKQAAEKFGISPQRVRQLLPTEAARKGASQPPSAFGQIANTLKRGKR